MRSPSDLRVLADGLDHPEGIATGPDGLLYAGGEAGQVYRIDPENSAVEEIARTGGFVLGVCLDGAAAIYVCDAARAAVLRVDPASCAIDVYCDAAGDAALTCPNWAAFARDGSLWLSDSGTESVEAKDGRLVRIPPGGGDGEIVDLPPLHFPNGLAVAADGRVYVLESFSSRLSVLTDAGLETIAELPGVVPDGVALDADGGYIVGCYFPFRVLRVSADGEVETLFDDAVGIYAPMPTNVSFFGKDLTILAIALYGGYAIKSLDIGHAGAGLHYPAS